MTASSERRRRVLSGGEELKEAANSEFMHSDWGAGPNEYEDEESGEYEDYEDDYETWCDYFSEELVTLYHSLKDHAAAMGLPMLEHMDMAAFCRFAFTYSSGRKPSA